MHRTARTAAVGLLTALLATLLGSLVILGAGSAQAFVDRDCGDFDTQAQAQSFYNNNSPSTDPHRLDDDDDRIACESLPCPCSTSTSSGGTSTGTVLRQRGRVTHVVDGDTVDVRLASTGVVKRVRMIGIDTPERSRCGYGRATRTLQGLVPVGTRVVLVSDPSQDLRDRYGRLLRYVVRLSDGRDVNRAQVGRGMARVYVYDRTPFRRVAAYRDSQYAARTQNRGLWATCW